MDECGAVEDADLDELLRDASRRKAVLPVEPNEVRARGAASPLEHAASFLEDAILLVVREREPTLPRCP